MLHKTKGIVLHSLNYNDRYKIVQIYTEAFGSAPYLVAKSRGKKTAVSVSLFHPFAVLDLEVERRNLREIQRIKEAHSCLALCSLPFDPVKIPLSIFLAEFMYRIVKEEQANRPLFEFVCQSIEVLDLMETSPANFHLAFMIRLTYFLGFYPNEEGYAPGMFFDMQAGVFVRYKPDHPFFLPPDESRLFCLLLRMNYGNMQAYAFSRQDRITIIRRILDYYRVHFSTLTELKSLDVLQALFD